MYNGEDLGEICAEEKILESEKCFRTCKANDRVPCISFTLNNAIIAKLSSTIWATFWKSGTFSNERASLITKNSKTNLHNRYQKHKSAKTLQHFRNRYIRSGSSNNLSECIDIPVFGSIYFVYCILA